MFSKVTSLTTRKSLLYIINSASTQLRMFNSSRPLRSPNNGGEETPEGVGRLFTDALNGLKNYVNQQIIRLETSITASADKIIASTDIKLAESAAKAEKNLSSTGEKLKDDINKTKNFLKTITGIGVILGGSSVYFLGKRTKGLESKIIEGETRLNKTTQKLDEGKASLNEATQKLDEGKASLNEAIQKFDEGINSLEKYKKESWKNGYLTALETELKNKEKLSKNYNDKINEYWPRPWPSYRTIYREKIEVVETEKEIIQEKIKELKNNPNF